MKYLAVSVLVVALAAVHAFPQSNGRKGDSAPAAAGSPAAGSEEASLPLLEPEKPFVPPCGLKQKLEANCAAGKTESTKEVIFAPFLPFIAFISVFCLTNGAARILP